MKIALMTLLLVALAVPVQAQPQPQPQQQQSQQEGRVRGMGGSGGSQRVTAGEIQKFRDTEKAYNETMKGIPNQKPADPWGKMR